MTRHIQNPAMGHYSAIFRIFLYNACICRKLAYSSMIASRRIFRTLSYLQNLPMFKTLTHLKPNTYIEPSQWFEMEFFAKIVKNYNHFSKALHLRSLTGFWIRLPLNKYSLTCDLALCIVWYIFRTLPIILNTDIEAYCGIFCEHFQSPAIFRILAYLKPNIYLELCQGIFWHILNISRTLPYSEFCHI